MLAKLVELLLDLHMGSSATIKAFWGGNLSISKSGAGSNRAAILRHYSLMDFVLQQAFAQFKCLDHRVRSVFVIQLAGLAFQGGFRGLVRVGDR